MKVIRKINMLLERIIYKCVWLPATLTRFSLGYLFMMTGWGKLHNLPKVIAFFSQLGIPAPEYQAPFVAATEFTCGLLLLAGLFVSLASIPLLIIMVVAIMTAKWRELATIQDLVGLSEYLLGLALVWLMVYGGGPISFDRFFRGKSGKKK